MKRIFALLLALCLLCAIPAHAAEGKVIYSGIAGDFVFAPGSQYSLTDLFPNFKEVMPGDTLTQKITVRNNASNQVKVKIYIRALGAHEDSVDFLSQLKLTVEKSRNNRMGYMFDAAAHETAQLTQWVCLGTLYSGGEVDLDVTLHVPTSLSNAYQDSIGYLDWEFMVEEFPVEDDDPQPPKPTGDNAPIGLWAGLLSVSGAMLILLLFWRKREKKDVK